MSGMEKDSPKLARTLLRIFIDNMNHDSLIGDFDEMYFIHRGEQGRLKANFWYWSQVLKVVPVFLYTTIYWSGSMFKNYLTIAIRNIRKHKGYSFINIAGLALGMAASILILLWIQDELSYDRFHKNADNIYWIISEHTTNTTYRTPNTPAPLAAVLREDCPEIENVVRMGRTGWSIRYGENGEHTYNERGMIADANFFEMFSFPLLEGDPATVLNDPLSLVITREMALSCFGDENPVGKILILDNDHAVRVSGVMDDVPTNSSLQFHFIIPFEFLRHIGTNLDHWAGFRYRTYIQVNKTTVQQEIAAKIEGILQENIPDSKSRLLLHPLKEIRLYDIEGGGAITYVYVFSAAAVLVLLIACINFMNLSTARSANRSREVGLRKVVGAFRMDIVKQFYGESILMSLMSLALAILLVALFLPAFNNLSGKRLTLEFLGRTQILSGLLGIVFLTGFVSGSYPALLLSSFQPSKVLKGKLSKGARGSVLRIVLVVIQFSLSIFLLICSLGVSGQMDFIKNKDMGFEKKNLIHMRTGDLSEEAYRSVKNDLLKHPVILNVTRTNAPLLWLGLETSGVSWERQKPDEMITVQIRTVDYDYLKTFGMRMHSGRFFSKEFSTDATQGYIVNEAAVKAMGMTSPLGKKFKFQDREGSIVGVVKDFHHHSMHDEIEPLIFLIQDWYSYMFVRIAPGGATEALNVIESYWERIDPGYPFSYMFMEDSIDRLYRSEHRTSRIMNHFTFLAVLIACLGLFGLASFMAAQRTKEIGIRKVLGAPVAKLIVLLSKEFTQWVLIANIIAWPAAYFIMRKWLQSFAYQTNIRLSLFLCSGIIALVIALITVGFQAVKAATVNPADSLRNE